MGCLRTKFSEIWIEIFAWNLNMSLVKWRPILFRTQCVNNGVLCRWSIIQNVTWLAGCPLKSVLECIATCMRNSAQRVLIKASLNIVIKAVTQWMTHACNEICGPCYDCWLVAYQHQVVAPGRSGPRLNIKTVLSTYGDFHVKDRTSYL